TALARTRPAQASGSLQQSLSAETSSSGADFSVSLLMCLLERLCGVDQRRLGAARIGPDEIADQHEIRTRSGEFGCLRKRGGKADTGRLEQFVPPLQALGDRLRRGPLALRIGLAEQHVIRTELARGHGIVSRPNPAAA